MKRSDVLCNYQEYCCEEKTCFCVCTKCTKFVQFAHMGWIWIFGWISKICANIHLYFILRFSYNLYILILLY